MEVTQSIDEKTILRLSLLNKGDTFGEIGVEGILSVTRTATVTSVMQTELLLLSTDTYHRIIMNEDTEVGQLKRNELIKASKPFLHVHISDQVVAATFNK